VDQDQKPCLAERGGIQAACRGPHAHVCWLPGAGLAGGRVFPGEGSQGLAATVQSRMAGANVARVMERAMGLDAED
jgi:hypothetical protein